jgi:hypothetical protein
VRLLVRYERIIELTTGFIECSRKIPGEGIFLECVLSFVLTREFAQFQIDFPRLDDCLIRE